MTKDVTITVIGKQKEVDPEPVVTVAKGTYKFENQNHYIDYNERNKDTSIYIVNNIVATNSKVMVNRMGAVNSKMLFEVQKKNTLEYTTPYGTIWMDIITDAINITESPTKLNIDIEYNMEVDKEHISSCSLSIEVIK